MFVPNRGKLGWVVMHETDIGVSLYHRLQTGCVPRPTLSCENERPYFMRFIGRWVKLALSYRPGVANGCRCTFTSSPFLTLRLLMSYIYGAPSKARNTNVVYTYMDLRLATLKQSLSICCTMFQHWINAERFPVSHLCVNTLPASWQSVNVNK